MNHKIAINGLKLSEALVPVWVDPGNAGSGPMHVLCRLLTAMQVNIAFMTSAGLDSGPALCCIDADDQPAVEAAVLANPDLAGAVRFGEQVGLLSLFPHKASLAILGVALQALTEKGIRIHGMASSIAALTFVIDFERLDEGAAILNGSMSLPPNPAALRADFKVRQEKVPR